LKGRAPLVLDPQEQAWFDIKKVQKDVVLALEAARQLGITMPTASAANDFLTKVRTLGYEHRDLAIVYQALDELSGAK
jgi:3-hydroxyisobutyrate dehydrogenase-like beta-hydroxyacid dehydrogenase